MEKNNNRKQHIAISAALNIIRRACMIAFPLITYAYATRVLGTEGIGVYEFSQSIVNYFAIVAALGISQYAVRDGAGFLQEISNKVHYTETSVVEGNIGENNLSENNTRELDKFVSEVFSINVVMTAISYIAMFALVMFVHKLANYSTAIMIYGISIIFTTLGVDWINSLFEDYLYLTVRYIVVSVIAIGALFIFVRKPEDLYAYIAISIFATVVNGILNFFYVRKFVDIKFTFSLNLTKHALPIFILFCNNIASVIYLNSDITILGILTNDDTVGLYGVASKVYNMIKELINAAIFVTIPRFSMYVANTVSTSNQNQSENVKSQQSEYLCGLRGLLTPLFSILLPACVGLFFLSDNVVYIVAGGDFLGGAVALRILSIAMFFAVMACFLAYAIIMPYKLERFFLVATSLAAGVNIILNFILIPIIGMPAAALTTLLAEIMVFVMLFCIANRKVNVLKIMSIKDVVATLVGTIFVGVVCYLAKGVAKVTSSDILGTILVVVCALLMYVVVEMVLGNTVVTKVRKIIISRLKHSGTP